MVPQLIAGRFRGNQRHVRAPMWKTATVPRSAPRFASRRRRGQMVPMQATGSLGEVDDGQSMSRAVHFRCGDGRVANACARTCLSPISLSTRPFGWVIGRRRPRLKQIRVGRHCRFSTAEMMARRPTFSPGFSASDGRVIGFMCKGHRACRDAGFADDAARDHRRDAAGRSIVSHGNAFAALLFGNHVFVLLFCGTHDGWRNGQARSS